MAERVRTILSLKPVRGEHDEIRETAAASAADFLKGSSSITPELIYWGGIKLIDWGEQLNK
jgi:hypothetical protein